MSYFEQGNTVVVGIVQGEGLSSTVLVVVGGKAGVGSLDAVLEALEDKVNNQAVEGGLLDMVMAVHMVVEAVGALVSMAVEDQLCKETKLHFSDTRFRQTFTHLFKVHISTLIWDTKLFFKDF